MSENNLKDVNQNQEKEQVATPQVDTKQVDNNSTVENSTEPADDSYVDFSVYKNLYEEVTSKYNEVAERLSAEPRYRSKLTAFIDSLEEQDMAYVYTRLYNSKLDEIPSEEIIKLSRKLNHPHLSESDINAWFEYTYSVKDSSDEDEVKRLYKKIEFDAKEAMGDILKAKKKIDAFEIPKYNIDKIDTSNVNNLKSFSNRISGGDVNKNNEEYIRKISTFVTDDLAQKPIRVETDVTGGKYELDFIPNLSEEELNQIRDGVIKSLISSNIPLEDAQGAALQLFNNAVLLYKFNEFVRAIVEDALASSKMTVISQVTNTPSPKAPPLKIEKNKEARLPLVKGRAV